MALLWCDGFDHYGSTAAMLNGAWAQVASGVSLSTTGPRTGTHQMRMPPNAGSLTIARRVLGGAKTTVGLGMALYVTALPPGNNEQKIFSWHDAANAEQLVLFLQSTGVVELKRGGSTSLGASAAPCIVANAYQHVECIAFFSQTVGTFECRVNGVTVLSLSGIDTCQTANVECSQVCITGSFGGSGFNSTETRVDDLFCYDDTGSYNNTFIGDRRVLTLFPDANTATADWTAVGAASGYLCIDEATPNDDTDYITAATVGLVSQFGLQNLPAGISVVNAVVMVERARKTEAGTANTQVSIVSGASTANGADKPLTEIYTYRQDVFQTDPATAAPFTPAAVDALQFKVARTA